MGGAIVCRMRGGVIWTWGTVVVGLYIRGDINFYLGIFGIYIYIGIPGTYLYNI